jgi:formylglycine-generating enzyme
VWEWCQGWYDEYEQGAVTDPVGPGTGQFRVMRGGGWYDGAVDCRSAIRLWFVPEHRFQDLGFRVAAVRVDDFKPGTEPEPVKDLVEVATFGDLEFLKIPPGEFMMGSPPTEPGRKDVETQHRVRMTQPFYLARYETTVQQWERLMGTDRERQSEQRQFFKKVAQEPDHPAVEVSWYDAIAYCQRLTEQHRKDGILPEGYVYTLPTEAQWEYACRAGSTAPFGIGDGWNISSRQANFDGNYPYGNAEPGPYLERTEAVGKYPPNRWGLHDMHGNVREWCWDWQSDYPVEADIRIDPAGPKRGQGHILRGGGWLSQGVDCRSASRDWTPPDDQLAFAGFRVAAVREEEFEARLGPPPQLPSAER